jgi:hypothetical protein
METIFQIGNSKGRPLLRRPRCRWERNIKMSVREIRHDVRNRFNWFWAGSSGECDHSGVSSCFSNAGNFVTGA